MWGPSAVFSRSGKEAMKITCQACQSKYTIADEKIQGKVAKIRCRKCGATVLVDGSGGNANGSTSTSVSGASIAPAPTAAASATGETWLVNIAEGDQRSMSATQLADALRTGVVSGDTYVWKDGMGDWLPVSQVEEIAELVSAPPAASVPPPVAEPAAAPAGGASRYAAAAVPTAGVGRRESARGRAAGATDLFGAGAVEEEVATSVPAHVLQARAASASAGASTASAGLGSGGDTAGSANLTGARDEHSVLFSLSALTAKSGDGSGGGKGVTEDSGLIDLNALAKAQAALGGEQARPAAPAAAPMLFPSALGTVEVPVAAAIGRKADEATAAAAASASAAAAAAAALAAAPPASAEPAAPAPDSSAAAADSASPTAPVAEKVVKKKAAAPRPAAGGVGAGAGAAVALPAPPPKPKASPCGCAPSDLQCQIRCSAMGK
jgi:predicted Zn finger-like uncharacterized protein